MTWNEMKMYKTADFSELEASVTMPEGYVIGSVAEYPGGKNPLGRDLGYTCAVQLIDTSKGLLLRGTGDSVPEALMEALRLQKVRGF